MYLELFGLREPSFRITPNTGFFFAGGSRGAILDALVYAIAQGEGIVKVSGGVGSGKTMPCRMLQARLPAHVQQIHLADPSVSPVEILHAIAHELERPLAAGASRLQVMQAITAHLLECHAAGRQVVLFVEESQSMPLATLEEIRLLSNLGTERHEPLQIVLFGQPELDAILLRADIRQLRERITYAFELAPLCAGEVGGYLDFRLRAAGYRGPALFPRAAVRLMARASTGLARRVNLLADDTRLAAFAAGTHAIPPRQVRAAVADGEFARHRRLPPGARLALAACAALMAACSTPVKVRPELPRSEGHLDRTRESAPVADLPLPVLAGDLVPPPAPRTAPATFSVVVTDVPVRELLLALARDARQNIDIHPGLSGRVTVNAINETLPAILERIARQVDMRVQLEGSTIVVQPDTPLLRVYRVNYVNMQRDTTATIGASGQIGGQGSGAPGGGLAGAAAAGAAPGGAGPGAGALNASSTLVRTTSQTHFWETLRENIRAILTASRAQTASAEDRAQRAEQARAAREERLAQAEAVSRAGAASTQLFNAVFGSAPPPPPVADARDSVVINSLAGTVNVLATERQHRRVQQYLDGVTRAVTRQVLIEATIAEVRLSDAYQAGVDWARLGNGATGFRFSQSLLGSNLASPPSVTVGYAAPNSGNVSATIKWLQQFGETSVLSSPKIMALNNQTSILRVTDNFVYFQVEAQQGAVTAGGAIQPTVFNTTAQTVPVGVVLAVTPQIDETGQVTLTVRPTITRVTGTVADPNPSLRQGVNPVQNLVPVIQTRELESVLQVVSGQTVMLGGLMQDDIQRNRDGVPWLSRQPGVGDLFSFRNERVSKTELVIFIRPTVISNPSLQSDELRFFQRFLPPAGDMPAAQPAASIAPLR